MRRSGAPPSGVFLLEIGTEEIPARMARQAVADLGAGLQESLLRSRLEPTGIALFGTPRRMAALVSGLPGRTPDEEIEVSGPPAAAAYDVSGRPTKAAVGFARAQGVDVGELRRVTTPKGECVAARRKVPGRPASDILAEIVPSVVGSMTFPKTMRWGLGEHRFVRPVHSVVALLDNQLVAMVIAGVRSGRETFGHRTGGESRIPLNRPADYLEALRKNHVIADVAERRQAIETLIGEAARRVSGRVAAPAGHAQAGGAGDPDLLEEVTHLVEWPLVISGEFDRAFLDLPADILVTAMRHHQKSFSLRDASGKLLNRFLAVANSVTDRTGAIRKGNEWVLRARLSDARFFWETDRKTPIASRTAALERLTYHEKLGSYAAKTTRIARLTGAIVPAFLESGQPPDPDAVTQAALLCKNDLTTQMVREFPELEGIVGGLYAEADGLPAAVWKAIYAHYLPRGAEDALPATPEGAILSLADRFDSQAGIFLLGIVPTGSRDPYGMRRSAHGACRILIENRVPLSLSALIDLALDGYDSVHLQGAVPGAQARAALLEFYRGRLQHLGEAAGLRPDSVRAALTASSDDPCDARLRMVALDAMRSEGAFVALAQAHKRIKNILKGQPVFVLDPTRLREEAETALFRSLTESIPAIQAAQARRDHLAALREIARCGPALDRFFEQVLVMAEERALRENRLALLQAMAALFLRVGDFSEIALEGEPAGAGARRASG
jgi:glycyl-tRNA synthetase beta chain